MPTKAKENSFCEREREGDPEPPEPTTTEQWKPAPDYKRSLNTWRQGQKYCPYKDRYEYPSECADTCKVVFPARHRACLSLHANLRKP